MPEGFLNNLKMMLLPWTRDFLPSDPGNGDYLQMGVITSDGRLEHVVLLPDWAGYGDRGPAYGKVLAHATAQKRYGFGFSVWDKPHEVQRWYRGKAYYATYNLANRALPIGYSQPFGSVVVGVF